VQRGVYKRQEVIEAEKKEADKRFETLYRSTEKREKAYRGWSERVYTDMLQLKTEVEKESQGYKRFNTAFRCVLKKIHSKKEVETDDETESGGSLTTGNAPDLYGLFDFRSIDCLLGE
jgi:hypothetical protein